MKKWKPPKEKNMKPKKDKKEKKNVFLEMYARYKETKGGEFNGKY